LTEAVRKSHESAELATKADLQEYESVIRGDLEKLELGLRHEMGDLRKDMDAKLVELKFDLLKWIIGLGIAQTGLLVALKLFSA